MNIEYYSSIEKLIQDYIGRNEEFPVEIDWANQMLSRVTDYCNDIGEDDLEAYKALQTKVCTTINNRIIKTKDQIEGTDSVFDTALLAGQIQKTFLARPLDILPVKEPFGGAGVYALYYSGEFPLYAPISLNNVGIDKHMPIYIGKAVLPGTRKNNVHGDDKNSPALYKRLKEHSETIQATANLSLHDFTCRYYVARENEYWMVQLLESTLIEKFNPIWNKVLDGFGNHDPGNGRLNQKRSFWDTVHPGRKWAEKLQNNKNALEIYKDMIYFYKAK
jgi:hypothetical protein